MLSNISEKVSVKTKISQRQVQSVVKLIEDGNTVPFIARYRKEATGNLDENEIREVNDVFTYEKNLLERKEEVVRLIEEQGKLTPPLKEQIEKAEKLQEVEDLYLPFRPKKRTRAIIAKEKGLEPLSLEFVKGEASYDELNKIALTYIDPEKGLNTIEEVLSGVSDIIAEDFSERAEVREWVRNYLKAYAHIESKKIEKAEDIKGIYATYYKFEEPVKSIPAHRILAINRGEKEKMLKVSFCYDKENLETLLCQKFLKQYTGELLSFLEKTLHDSLSRLILPSLERELRVSLTEKAEEVSIANFAKNLRSLLLISPLKDKTVLAIDPAFRTGCKIAVVNKTGDLLETTAVYPHEPVNKWDAAKKFLKELIEKHNVNLISIGNGTASRETEKLAVEIIKELIGKRELYYMMTNEAGASVYSASKVAQEEFPDLDVSIRGGVSIARRVQDPLAELVKIEPRHIGVGLYQHDVNPKLLDIKLGEVVESIVNYVGVNLNTASVSLLSYVSGLSKRIAENIVQKRIEQGGMFKNRKDLLNVKSMGPKTFEQCAGFLRIPGGDEPLDNTSVHPESYGVCKKLLQKLEITPEQLSNNLTVSVIEKNLKKINLEELIKELNVGRETLVDIIGELKKPGRDPRDEIEKPILKSEILSIEDLKSGMSIKGTIRNVVDFGAFVDIGLKNDALLHISQITNRYIKHPGDVLNIGDIVDVKVLEIDKPRGRISLTAKG